MLAEFQIVPIGTKGASLSEILAKVAKLIDQSGLDYRVGPMGTTVEGVVGKGDERDRQGPGSASQPLGVVNFEPRPEHVSGRRIEQLPRAEQVDGRVTDSETAKVQHAGQPTVGEQQILRDQVAVVPAICLRLRRTRQVQGI